MEKTENLRLTSTEMATLWITYINDSMAICVLRYFLNKVEDTEVKHILESGLHISNNHIEVLTSLFISEEFPVPQGFTDDDVNVHAKRLFSDSFFLYYIKSITKVGISTYGLAYSMASRSDIRKFFHDCIMQTVTLDQEITEVLQSKGIYIRPPYVTNSDHIDFVKDKSFLSGGFFGLGEKRPLLSIEIAHLFSNIQTNALGKALLMGFSQVVRSNKIRQYLTTGKDISTKHVKIFSDTLINDDIPTPMSWDTDVMDSTEAPFSDKLILFHVTLLVVAGTANYGASTASSPRKDIAANYVRLAAEIATYAEEGVKLMIENGWLEEPPHAPNRKALVTN